MNIYTCHTFKGHWPVPTAAVVVANSSEMAAALLNESLEQAGLSGDVLPDQMDLLDTRLPAVKILSDGNY